MTPAGGRTWRGGAPAVTLAVALAALITGSLAAACDVGFAPSARPSARPSSSAGSGALAGADRLLYSGDYQGAESGYRHLSDGDPHAEAHLAVLLAYESRFPEALAAAAQAAASRPDSIDLAALTRARDWSQDYEGALEAGAAAVRAQPAAPLARAFYGEALADSGLYQQSRRQLEAAQAAARDAYTRSEVDREWANLYRDEGDPNQQLNYFQLSERAQPAFPERTLEIARYDYQAAQPAAARALLSGLRSRYSKRYRVLEEAAESALYVGGDRSVGCDLFRAALAAAHNAPEAGLGLAVIEANAHRFQAAHDLLVPLLRRHPDSADVYSFLLNLDRMVLKVDPRPDLAPASPAARAQLAADRAQALGRVNRYRTELGFAPLAEDPALAGAAQAHAYYVLFNQGAPQLSGLGVHSETPTLPGFTGATGLDRAAHLGFRGDREAEVIDHVDVPANAVQTWIDSVYHRFPLLDAESTAAGFGTARAGSLSVEVMEVGLAPAVSAAPALYPYPNQTGVPPGFIGNEIPDPAPGARYPIGYPVTVEAGGSDALTVSRAQLLDASGQPVAVYLVAPGTSNPDLQRSQWAMLARRPLVPGAVYTADLTGALDGQPFHRRWSFTVEALA